MIGLLNLVNKVKYMMNIEIDWNKCINKQEQDYNNY